MDMDKRGLSAKHRTHTRQAGLLNYSWPLLSKLAGIGV